MKKIILSAVLSSFVLPSFAMSFNQAAGIYEHILNSNGLHPAPGLVYSNDPSVNASSGGFRITLNQGMLSYVGGNKDQMALVLGHEIGHYKLGHRMSTPKNEYASDKYGARLMHNAGYNVCRGATLFKRLGGGDTKTHPAGYKRAKALGC